MPDPTDPPSDSLDAAYAIRTPEDSVRLYATWAATYEQDFADRMDWAMPGLVTAEYLRLGGSGPVLDAGAGTGLLGQAVASAGIGPIDGIDISPQMLDRARAKGVYRTLTVADLTQALPLPDAAYRGVVSAGTFTHGHVGPAAFGELLRVMRPGAVFAGSIHPGVYHDMGFAAAFDTFGPRIAGLTLIPAKGFGPKATGDHAADMGMIVTFRRT
jgi:predicted TPR repeat methyltransferase